MCSFEVFMFLFWHPLYTSPVLRVRPPLTDWHLLNILVCLSKKNYFPSFPPTSSMNMSVVPKKEINNHLIHYLKELHES